MEGQIEEGDLVRLRGKWQETMAKIHGASPAPRAAPEYAHMKPASPALHCVQKASSVIHQRLHVLPVRGWSHMSLK